MTPPSRMPSHPSWRMMRHAINELYDSAKCRCEDYWTGRDMHAPECQSDLIDHIETVDAYVEFLEQEALSLKQRIAITEEALKASLAREERVNKNYEQECSGVDRILVKLGLDPERVRSEGGCLNLPRILNHIGETLVALEDARSNHVYFADKYIEAQQDLTRYTITDAGRAALEGKK